MKPRTLALLLLAAFAAGSGAGFLLARSWHAPARSSPDAAGPEQATRDAELDEARALLVASQEEARQLRSLLERRDAREAETATITTRFATSPEADAEDSAQDPNAAPPPGPGFDRARMAEQFETFQARQDGLQLNARTASLRQRLNLTPEQEAQLRAYLEQDAARRRDQMRRLFAGEPPEEGEMPAFPGMFGAPDQQLDEFLGSILTGEQQDAFAQYQDERAQNQIEMRVTSELMGLQQMLGMNAGQQDRAFTAMAELAAQYPPFPGASPEDFMEYLNARNEALRPILTPEQMGVLEGMGGPFFTADGDHVIAAEVSGNSVTTISIAGGPLTADATVSTEAVAP